MAAALMTLRLVSSVLGEKITGAGFVHAYRRPRSHGEKMRAACFSLMIALTCVSAPAAAAQTFDELNVRCINLGRVYSQSEQVLACTRQLALPRLSVQTQAHIYNNRGNAFRSNREYGSAIADYDEAIRLDPTYANAYNNRGIANRAAGLADRAVADFNAALGINPEFASAYGNRGSAYADRGDLSHAISDYTRAVELDPDYSNAYNNRGNLYRQLREYRRAIADFDEAVRINPQYANAYNNRGRTYQAMGEMERALNDFERARQIEPDNPAYQGFGMRR